MKSFYLTLFLTIIISAVTAAQKEKHAELPSPPVIIWDYIWHAKSTASSTRKIIFKPFTDNAELVTTNNKVAVPSIEKFKYSELKNDSIILENSSRKIFLQLKKDKGNLRLINLKTNEIFLKKIKEPSDYPEPLPQPL